MTSVARALAVALVLIAAAGCSRRPSVADIERQLGHDTSGCENIRVRDVKKVNGYEDGANRYVAEVTYVMEIRDYPDNVTAESNTEEAVRRAQCLIATLPLRMAGAAAGNADRVQMHQDVVMRRTENGWQIVESLDR